MPPGRLNHPVRKFGIDPRLERFRLEIIDHQRRVDHFIREVDQNISDVEEHLKPMLYTVVVVLMSMAFGFLAPLLLLGVSQLAPEQGACPPSASSRRCP